MKVAIIGAGVSGLSCALELKRHNITPVIYEKNDKIGDLLGYPMIWPRLCSRVNKDSVRYLRQEYGISLKPLNYIRKIVMYSPHKKAVQHGSMGYIFKKGFESYSLENQLASKLNTQILFNQYIDIGDIKGKYDCIVVATGFNTIARDMGIWTDTFSAIVRTANAVGKFNSSSVTMWLDKDYCKNGFCYFIPISEKQATLAMVVNGITARETDYYWKQFLIHENISCTITETMDSGHVCGFSKPLSKDNILFVGNAGGFTDDFLGCGAPNAIESGILAARAIVFGEDYNTLAAPIYAQIEKLHEIRKAMNNLENADYDRMIALLDIPFLKNTIYNSTFFRLAAAVPFAKAYNTIMSKRKGLK